jgi:hypothetical protein
MAPKKKVVSGVDKSRPKNNPVTPAKKSSGDRPGPWDNIGRGLKTAGKVTYEVSGAGDVKRFAQNPSLKNAASLGLTVASYAGGPALRAAAVGRAANASFAAQKAVLSTRAAKVGLPIAEKSMKFSRPAGAKALNVPKGNLVQASGKKVAVSGFEKATTAKNVNRVQAGRAAAVNIQATKAGKVAAKQTMKAAAPKIKAANIAGIALAGSKAGTTVSADKNKNKKKK